MTQDIKDIAKMMGTQFAGAVELAEKNDAEQIESIMKSMNDSWQICNTRLIELKNQREECMGKLVDLYIQENEVMASYEKENQELIARLRMFKDMKLGARE